MAERSDEHYLCFNCGEITHREDWSMWQPDGDHEFGEADYRPHGLRQNDSDAILKCPRCGEMHGDNYMGAGIEEGTRAVCEAERAKLLADDRFSAEEWADALAASAPSAPAHVGRNSNHGGPQEESAADRRARLRRENPELR